MARKYDAYAELVDLIFAEANAGLGKPLPEEFMVIIENVIRQTCPNEAHVQMRLEKYKADPTLLLREFQLEEAMKAFAAAPPSIKH